MNHETTTIDAAARRNGTGVDRVLLLLLVSCLVLAVWSTQQAVTSVRFVLEAMFHILPFFLLAIGFAAYAKASGMDQLISRAFSRGTVLSVVTASLAGALSPFCSCGVIPLIAAMLASGVPLAPVMAFCISSPVMDPEMFLLTAAGIHLPFAVAKTAAAVGMGLFAGFSVVALQRRGHLLRVLKQDAGRGCGTPPFRTGGKLPIRHRFWKDDRRRAVFGATLRENGFFLGKWMTLAFFVESLMIAYIPTDWVSAAAGSDSALAIPIAALIGVPAYLNGYAAIPVVSGLMDLGMDPGAALAFMTAGAVSSIPAAMAVFALVRRPVFALYLALGLVGSLGAGFGYQVVLRWA